VARPALTGLRWILIEHYAAWNRPIRHMEILDEKSILF
jgi:hypothetical protein